MLYPKLNAYRELVGLDGIYRFAPNREDRASGDCWPDGLPVNALELAVPGSWNEQLRDLHEFHGEGWYERDFYVPASWGERCVFLRIGSTAGNARVWVDGCLLGEHIGPHLPFEFELKGGLKSPGAHRLTIAVDNTLRWMSLPPGQARRDEDRAGFGLGCPDVPYDFFPYGGIHRSVQLYAVNRDHISDLSVRTSLDAGSGHIEIAGKIRTRETGLRMRVEAGAYGVESSVEGGTVEAKLTIPSVRPWCPADPHLYKCVCTLVDESGTVADEYVLQIGVRTVEVRGNELLLNGEPIFLHGFGKHEDFPILGKAWAPAVAIRDYDLMRWIGANSFRTSHYPYAEEMLDMADRLGFLVIDETPFVSLSERVYTDACREQACAVIRELIERDRNHPSVILWSLANEPYIESDAGERFFREMAACAREADPSRPVMYVAHESPQQNRGAECFDLIGVNKYFGWYHETGDIDGSLHKLTDILTAFHLQVNGPVLLAEFGADAVAGLHSDPPVLFSEEYQADTICKQYQHVRNLPWLIGTHVWNFADFKTAQTINRVGGNKKGVFTRDRQPKLAAHTLRQLWNDTDAKPTR